MAVSQTGESKDGWFLLFSPLKPPKKKSTILRNILWEHVNTRGESCRVLFSRQYRGRSLPAHETRKSRGAFQVERPTSQRSLEPARSALRSHVIQAGSREAPGQSSPSAWATVGPATARSLRSRSADFSAGAKWVGFKALRLAAGTSKWTC